MLSEADRQRARFAPNDPVEFGYQDYLLKGTLVRLNPKRAVVLIDDEEFTVPYERLTPRSDTAGQRLRKIEAVHESATQLLNAHGLATWKFKFDDSTRRAGCCDFRNKIISISFSLAQNGSDEDISDTILHEIAHALVGKKHNHDAVWKSKAIEIGCSGKRTHDLEFATPRWTVTCENRCWTHTAQQRNLKLICRKCGAKLIFSPYTPSA